MRCRRGWPIPSSHFPYLLLLVSGGHCQLLLVEGVGRYRRLATTIDDAAGEAFDKTAKLLGLGYPGGPAVEQRGARTAIRGGAAAAPAGRQRRAAFLLRRPQERGAARQGQRPICATPTSPRRFQQAVIDCLVDRTAARARRRRDGATALVVAGGVAANQAVRARAEALAAAHGLPFVAPPLWLCTDNAAMIGWAGRGALRRRA